MSGWPSTRLLAILGLTLAILSTALSAPAQTPGKIPHIGYIWIGAEGSDRVTRPGLQKGLRELGYQEGRDIIIEYRNAGGSIERLRASSRSMAADRFCDEELFHSSASTCSAGSASAAGR